MDPQEMMVFLSILPDEALVRIADEEATLLSQSFAADDLPAMVADSLLSQMIHAEMIWRNLDGDALDFFAKVNAIRPVLDGLTYSEYVEFVRDHRPA